MAGKNKQPAQRKKKGEGNKGGRPRYEVDYRTLTELCRIHCTGEECASVLGVNYDTLNSALKRDGEGSFSDFYKKHAVSGKAALRRVQWKKALSGNATMLIWLGKQVLGQKDRLDHTTDDESMKQAGTIDMTRLSRDALEEIINASKDSGSEPE